MSIVGLTAGIGLVGAFLGWSVGRLTGGGEAGEGKRSSALGFAGLGLAFGMALGLSTSPVLGASLAAGFALIGTLIPLYFPKPAAPDAAAAQAAKPVAVGVWLFPFAVSSILGMVLGIELRVNDALDFRGQNLRERFLAQGFTAQQTGDIMDRLAKSIHDPSTAQAAITEAKDKGKAAETGLQASAARVDWKDYWTRMDRLGLTPDQVLAEFKKIAPAQVLEQIRRLEAESAREILKTVRHDHPEIGG